MKWLLIIGVLLMAAGGGILSTLDSIVERMALAIKNFEGWYPGSRSYRNNNPGNIRWRGTVPNDGSGGGVLKGAIGKDSTNHLIYQSEAAGWAALLFQVRIAFTGESSVYSPSMTFYDFFEQYAEGNQVQYAENVAAKLGVSANSTLGGLLA